MRARINFEDLKIMPLKRILKSFGLWCIGLLLLTLFTASSTDAADIGNCLLCHKYPGLSRVDKDGNHDRYVTAMNKIVQDGRHAELTLSVHVSMSILKHHNG